MKALRVHSAATMGSALLMLALSSFPSHAADYKTSLDHYAALKAAAHGGTKMTWDKLPDWSGLWERAGGFAGLNFDATQKPNERATAQLTPEYEKRYQARLDLLAKNGTENDPIALCYPAGFPRMLAEPYTREFILRPEQVWWTLEQNNETRRIYTDGRDHLPDDIAPHEVEGDSIGFWAGDTLVVHTSHLRAGQYQKNQPDYSDQVSTVERIRKVDADTIEDEVWVYDPPALVKPWHVVARYKPIKGVEYLRVDYWPCVETSAAFVAPDGTLNIHLPGETGDKK